MASRIFSLERSGGSAKPSSAQTQRCRSVKRMPRGSTSGWASIRAWARSSVSVQCSARAIVLLAFLDLVDRIAGNLHDEIAAGDDRLAGQARQRCQPPGLVEQVVLVLLGGRQRGESLAHDDVA